LNMGATPLSKACPRSLKAFISQLNHGESAIETPIETKAIRGPITPNKT
jgi:hypothetical protein